MKYCSRFGCSSAASVKIMFNRIEIENSIISVTRYACWLHIVEEVQFPLLEATVVVLELVP